MALIGYTRVSTGEQDLAPQLDALRAVGCAEMLEEHASGASRVRPQLVAALARVRRGDTLVVARIDRLARCRTCSRLWRRCGPKACTSAPSPIPSTRRGRAGCWGVGALAWFRDGRMFPLSGSKRPDAT